MAFYTMGEVGEYIAQRGWEVEEFDVKNAYEKSSRDHDVKYLLAAIVQKMGDQLERIENHLALLAFNDKKSDGEHRTRIRDAIRDRVLELLAEGVAKHGKIPAIVRNKLWETTYYRYAGLARCGGREFDTSDVKNMHLITWPILEMSDKAKTKIEYKKWRKRYTKAWRNRGKTS